MFLSTSGEGNSRMQMRGSMVRNSKPSELCGKNVKVKRKFSVLSFSFSDYLVSSSLKLLVITPVTLVSPKHPWKLYMLGCVDL